MLNYKLIYCLILLNVHCLLANTQTWGGLPGLFSIVRYQNSACENENGDSGVCILESECKSKNLQSYRTCPTNSLVCCVSKFTCGQTTSQNETEFVNPNYPFAENSTDTCQVTFDKPANVCQLRLDFEEFSLAQPDKNGLCTTDSFMIRTSIGERLPIICGENKGQHIYIHVGQGTVNPVVLSVISNGNQTNRRWKIRISTIPCNNLSMAPSGCLQYYRGLSATVKSFNFGLEESSNEAARYLANLRYTSCIRLEENFCSIKWKAESLDSFNFGVPKDAINKTDTYPFGLGEDCDLDDFISIDQASQDGTDSGKDRFCGKSLNNTNFVISTSKPFQLRVRTNLDHFNNSKFKQTGFSLLYIQLPCVI